MDNKQLAKVAKLRGGRKRGGVAPFPGSRATLPGKDRQDYEDEVKRWYESIRTKAEKDALPWDQKEFYDRVAQNLGERRNLDAYQDTAVFKEKQKDALEDLKNKQELATEKNAQARIPQWAKTLEQITEIGYELGSKIPGPVGEIIGKAKKVKEVVTKAAGKK
jgi:hypothetical protein